MNKSVDSKDKSFSKFKSSKDLSAKKASDMEKSKIKNPST